MARLAIRATFPLGTYLGHDSSGQRSPFPDVARLHSALMHAAGKGSTAVERKGDLRPCGSALEALRWLEQHPPSAIEQPPLRHVSQAPALSWRSEGVHDGKPSEPSERKVLKSRSDAVALSGPLGWAWEDDVPDEIVDMVKRLCEDVSCLGEADSPVVFEVVDIAPTHVGARRASHFEKRAPGELRIGCPTPGRVAELEAVYDNARPAKSPTVAGDRHAWSQQPGSNTPTRQSVTDYAYQPVRPAPPQEPWSTAMMLHVDRAIPVHERVRWCVAVHRSLASHLQDAPPLVTGAYPAGAAQPANRLAVHYVQDGWSEVDGKRGGFVLMVPPHAETTDLAPLERAARAIKRVYVSRDLEAQVQEVTTLDPASFWPEPTAGMRRLWSPVPALVPEARRQRRGSSAWTLTDAALLAVGHVLRERLDGLHGRDRYRTIVEQVRGWGVRAYDVRRIPDSRVERYAHKVPSGVVTQPYTATFDLAGLIGDQVLFALGQSRHLGGGLMYPVDVHPDLVTQLNGDSDAPR